MGPCLLVPLSFLQSTPLVSSLLSLVAFELPALTCVPTSGKPRTIKMVERKLETSTVSLISCVFKIVMLCAFCEV